MSGKVEITILRCTQGTSYKECLVTSLPLCTAKVLGHETHG